MRSPRFPAWLAVAVDDRLRVVVAVAVGAIPGGAAEELAGQMAGLQIHGCRALDPVRLDPEGFAHLASLGIDTRDVRRRVFALVSDRWTP